MELIHSDNVEGFKVKSIQGYTRGYLFVDDYSRSVYFYPVKNKKGQTYLQCLKDLNTRLKSDSRSIKTIVLQGLQSDWAKEISAGANKAWCDEVGIKLQHSAPGSHQENGVVEKAVEPRSRLRRPWSS